MGLGLLEMGVGNDKKPRPATLSLTARQDGGTAYDSAESSETKSSLPFCNAPPGFGRNIANTSVQFHTSTMNALEGRLKCVVFLTCRGEKGANNQAGFASKTIVGACQFVVIQKPVCLTPVQETISAHINQFCKAHGVSFMNYALDKSALIADSVSQLPHVSLHICSQDDLETLAECLLRHRSPSVLLVEIRCDSPISKDDVESAAGDEWDWLRPKQSCMAELRHEEWDNANELLPVSMWCAEPVIRSFPRSAELANETSIVTLDGLMRELGYKVGCLPKYGS